MVKDAKAEVIHFLEQNNVSPLSKEDFDALVKKRLLKKASGGTQNLALGGEGEYEIPTKKKKLDIQIV